MVNQKASIGDVKMNSHYFNHFNLDDIRITANGLSVLDSEVTFGNTKKYSCLFKRVINALKTNKHSISYDNFNSGYTIISVDCQNSETNSIIQIERQGLLEIHLKFSQALVNTINIMVIGETVGSVEIDSERRVSTHYNY